MNNNLINPSSSSLSVINKLLSPVIEHNNMINNMTDKEKIAYIKYKYGLTHGKGKRKKHRK